jgi:hypothetical protein
VTAKEFPQYMTSVTSVINLLIAPAALISASALMLRVITERLLRLKNRIRVYEEKCQETVKEALTIKERLPSKGDFQHHKHHYKRKLRIFREEGTELIKKANTVKRAVNMLEISLMFSLLTGFVASLTMIAANAFVPLSLFCCGIGMMFLISGILLSLKDVSGAMITVESEFFASVDEVLSENGQFVF